MTGGGGSGFEAPTSPSREHDTDFIVGFHVLVIVTVPQWIRNVSTVFSCLSRDVTKVRSRQVDNRRKNYGTQERAVLLGEGLRRLGLTEELS